jgi:hypothetical protein
MSSIPTGGGRQEGPPSVETKDVRFQSEAGGIDGDQKVPDAVIVFETSLLL